MLSATLDTSCALNFLGEDEQTSDAVVDVVAAAIAGRVSVRVTDQAHEEVARTVDDAARSERLKRLRAFGRLELPAHRRGERDALARRLHDALFPGAQAGSRTDAHNERDCLQLATHQLVGRDVFVTLDGTLRRRARAHTTVAVDVIGPKELLDRLETEHRVGQLPSPPSIAVRDVAADEDEAAVRDVLAPLTSDYPDFSGWLTRALVKAAGGQARIRVGLVGGRIGAVALSSRKDDRVMKLSAFFVAEWAREVGLGQHLLWSEIRTWAQAAIEKVYVTVSSRHGELIDFFRTFGFLIEGISARRYQDDTAELVLGKHLVRRTIADVDTLAFVVEIASRVFGAPASVTSEPSTFALTPRVIHPVFRWEGRDADARLVASGDGHDVRSWDLLALETIFHPIRFVLSERRALIVPIRPEWAEAMLDYPAQQLTLLRGQERSEKLLLRSENAYYCFPTALQVTVPGTPILFLVTGGTGLIGEARIIDAVIDTPEELFARFGGLGIYGIQQIRSHVQRRGAHTGAALALHFGLYVPFERVVGRPAMHAALNRNLQAQTITPIAMDEFEELRRIGGLTW